jgi:hypothetical protein
MVPRTTRREGPWSSRSGPRGWPGGATPRRSSDRRRPCSESARTPSAPGTMPSTRRSQRGRPTTGTPTSSHLILVPNSHAAPAAGTIQHRLRRVGVVRETMRHALGVLAGVSRPGAAHRVRAHPAAVEPGPVSRRATWERPRSGPAGWTADSRPAGPLPPPVRRGSRRPYAAREGESRPTRKAPVRQARLQPALCGGPSGPGPDRRARIGPARARRRPRRLGAPRAVRRVEDVAPDAIGGG